MPTNIDKRDLEILYILERDGRTPWRQIAKQLGVSESTVYMRVNRLMRNGILKGFTVRLDLEALGLKARVLIFLKARAGYLNKVRSEISKRSYVLEAYEVTGRYNFLAIIASRSLDEAAKLIDDLSEIEGVEDVETVFVLRKLKEPESIVDMLLSGINEKEWGGGQARASGHPPPPP